jgi:hypothetical protein
MDFKSDESLRLRRTSIRALYMRAGIIVIGGRAAAWSLNQHKFGLFVSPGKLNRANQTDVLTRPESEHND